MYNAHRGMVSTPNIRLTELLDQVRTEFENQVARTGEYEHQITTQMSEMELVRQKVYQLEQQQIQIKQKYDDEIARLHQELAKNHSVQSQPPHVSGPPHSTGHSQGPQPPVIGHGNGGLFGGIMANGPNQGLAPPQEQPQQQQPPHQMPQPPPALTQQGPPPPQQPFTYPQSQPLNNGKLVSEAPILPVTSTACTGGYGAQPPQPTASPGPARRKPGPPGPPTPQQNPPAPYPDPRASPRVARPTPPLVNPNVGNTLADLDPDRLPPNQKKEGADWFAIFNPRVQRVLDVDLVHTLPHDSVVCCVRFSHDGKYVATGCNRSAQIFDVQNGVRVSYLQDDAVDKDGDLYIRSVCFSPDGRYLATGAEDKVIRVWDIKTRAIKHTFTGHEQDIYSLDFASNGRHIASGSGDRTVRVWDNEAGQQVLTLQIEDGVTTVAISPDGHFVAAGSLDKSVRVWDVTTGNLVERLEGQEGHKDSVYSVAFAPNGRDLVSGSLDKTIKMWELQPLRGMLPGAGPRGGKCIRTFEGHKDFVLSVALTPDGRWVLSGSKDRGVQFWDPQSGNTQLMLQGHKNSGKWAGTRGTRDFGLEDPADESFCLSS
ncbi:MAG: general transcription repressor [Geoglossum simile]|nr:MAG: general transcription repressor [Geoglossum simile]